MNSGETLSKNLTSFEKTIIDALLEGNDPNLSLIKQQLQNIESLERTFTGVGFFIDFQIHPSKIYKLTVNVKPFGDVIAELKGLKYGVGFVLFFKDGYISTLEGYTHSEDWPETPKITSLSRSTSLSRFGY